MTQYSIYILCICLLLIHDSSITYCHGFIIKSLNKASANTIVSRLSSSPSSTIPHTFNDQVELERNCLKLSLFEIAAKSCRGQITLTESDSERLIDIVSNLEAINPALDDMNQCSDKQIPSIIGEWDLVYTDSQLFLSSPFFLTIRELFGSSQADRAKEIFQLHRAATKNGQFGRISQVITPNELVSSVQIEMGILPGQPYSVKGTVISSADLEIQDQFTAKLKLKGTRIQESNLPLFSYIEKLVTIDVRKVVETVMSRSIPECSLMTYYNDNHVRITRNVDDNIFIYTRVK